MNKLLEEAIDAASRLPDAEQEALARWILEEIKSEQRWQAAFDASGDVLDRLADEALKEHREGRTEELDPDKL
jgi:hypothetical protein